MGQRSDNLNLGRGARRPRDGVPARALRTEQAPRPAIIVIGASTGGPATFAGRAQRSRTDLGAASRSHSIAHSGRIHPHGRRLDRNRHRSSDAARARWRRNSARPRLSFARDRHISLGRKDETSIIRLLDTPPENFCRPSMTSLRSAAKTFGAAPGYRPDRHGQRRPHRHTPKSSPPKARSSRRMRPPRPCGACRAWSRAKGSPWQFFH